MKIKIFEEFSSCSLEEKINSFIEKNEITKFDAKFDVIKLKGGSLRFYCFMCYYEN